MKMKNKWLSLFIPKVQIIVPTMTEVNRLRQRDDLWGEKTSGWLLGDG